MSITKYNADKFILYSGGAIGADTLFGINAEMYGITEQNYSFKGHINCRSRGRVILAEKQLEEADEDLYNFIGEVYQKQNGTIGKKYWQRNWFQVHKTKEVFAIVKDLNLLLDYTKETIEGTSIGITLAIQQNNKCRRIFIYNQASNNWYLWERDKKSSEPITKVDYKMKDVNTRQVHITVFDFMEVQENIVKITETDFTGIGTRELSNQSVEAINRLFMRSFL